MHQWLDDGHLSVDDVVFRLTSTGDGANDGGRLLLFKPPEIVEEYLRRADELRGARVFEVGVFRGGSTAFLTVLLDPERLVAVEIEPERNAWLDEWLHERGVADRVRVHHGVDQSDRARMAAVVRDEFGGEPLDLVVDDASHLLTPTTRTFNVLFPRVRPGGLFVIEDWSNHLSNYRMFTSRPERLGRALEARPELFARRLREHPDALERILAGRPELVEQALTERTDVDPPPQQRAGEDRVVEKRMWRLIMQLVRIAGAYPEVIPHIEIVKGFAAIRRGPAELDPETFDLRSWLPGTERDNDD